MCYLQPQLTRCQGSVAYLKPGASPDCRPDPSGLRRPVQLSVRWLVGGECSLVEHPALLKRRMQGWLPANQETHALFTPYYCFAVIFLSLSPLGECGTLFTTYDNINNPQLFILH